MTAVTTDGVGLTLLCDACDVQVPGLGDTMYHWRLAWSFMRQRGWAGSQLAVGPHRCNVCMAKNSPARPMLPASTAEDRPAWRAGVVETDGGGVITLHGELDLLVNDPLTALLADADRRYDRLLVDLSDVPMIDSTVLGTLVRFHLARAERHAPFVLACPSPAVQRVLAVMSLDDLLVVLPDRASVQAWAG